MENEISHKSMGAVIEVHKVSCGQDLKFLGFEI